MKQDVTVAWRSFRRSPTYPVVAVLVLALGMGASTAVFSVVDAVVIRGLPFDEHDRLVAVTERHPAVPNVITVAPQNFLDWDARQQSFESLAAVADATFILRDGDGPGDEIRGQRVTADFFSVLRARPALGMLFTAASEAAGDNRVAVLSDGFWQSRFGGDPGVVGRTLSLDGVPFLVTGVMPPDFSYPVAAAQPTQVWTPLVFPPEERVRTPRLSMYLQVLGRLKPGVSVAQAASGMDQIAVALEAENPSWNKDRRTTVVPLHEHLIGGRMRSWLLLLLGAVVVVLAIAWANVANLMVARAGLRVREMSLRAALGASHWRIVRQLLVESVMLSLGGVLLGIALAWFGTRVMVATMPADTPRLSAVALDLRVMAVAIGGAILFGIVFGLAPVFHAWRPAVAGALRDGARVVTSRPRERLRSLLVVGDIALATVLLVAAGLFVGSFVALQRVDLGFDASGVLAANLGPRFGQNLPNRASMFVDLASRLEELPQVEYAAGLAGTLPLGRSLSPTRFAIPGRALADNRILISNATHDYHRAMRIALRRGRYLEATDGPTAPSVLVINDAAADKFFPGEDPIGRVVELQGRRTIVGVVASVRPGGQETPAEAAAYIPMAQSVVPGGQLIVRTEGDPTAVVAAVRSAVYAVAPDLPLREVTSLEDVLSRVTAQRRFSMVLLSAFGLMGLVIAVIGVYGLMSYLVAQRRTEFGVRLALGSSRARLVSSVMTQAAILGVAGAAIGTVGARLLAPTAQAFLFEITATDVSVFGTAALALAAAALVACLVPAYRAATVDPIVTLRGE